MVKVWIGVLVAVVVGAAVVYWPGGGAEQQVATSLPSLAELPTLPVKLSVKQAYQAIPHRRTSFAAGDQGIAADDRAYLDLMFGVLDRAVVLRVWAEQEYAAGRFQREAPEGYRDLIQFLEPVQPPAKLKKYHRFVLEALTQQQAFFREYVEREEDFPYPQRRSQMVKNASVHNASQALHNAYEALRKAYPAATRHNQMAFFDYHCALDFL